MEGGSQDRYLTCLTKWSVVDVVVNALGRVLPYLGTGKQSEDERTRTTGRGRGRTER